VTRKHDPERASTREALGMRLKLLRVHARRSQVSVAQTLEVRPATVSSWEQGESELAALDALRLADLYGVELAVVFGRALMPTV